MPAKDLGGRTGRAGQRRRREANQLYLASWVDQPPRHPSRHRHGPRPVFGSRGAICSIPGQTEESERKTTAIPTFVKPAEKKVTAKKQKPRLDPSTLAPDRPGRVASRPATNRGGRTPFRLLPAFIPLGSPPGRSRGKESSSSSLQSFPDCPRLRRGHSNRARAFALKAAALSFRIRTYDRPDRSER